MKIGLLAPPWVPVPPPAYGGIELVLDLLARGLHAAGHDVVLFTTGDATCPVRRRWCYPRAETQRMGMGAPELRHVIAGYAALADCDIVHDHTVTGPLYAHGWVERPAVTTNHAPFDDEMRALYQAVSDRVPVIAISRAQAADAAGVRLAGVVHHGLDVKSHPSGAGEGGYLLFLGRMAPEKGARHAIVVARRAGLPLVMAARIQGPAERAYFEREVRPHLADDVRFVGEVGGADKHALLGRARALVNPIRWPEPFGLVMLEAMACGTPVLASKEGAAPEIVEHEVTGFLCADLDDMVDKVARVGALDRAACRRRVLRRFSVERMVEGHLEIYDRVLREHPAPRGTATPGARRGPRTGP